MIRANCEMHSADGKTYIEGSEHGPWDVYIDGRLVVSFRIREDARIFIRMRKGKKEEGAMNIDDDARMDQLIQEARETIKERKIAEIAAGCLKIESWDTCRCDDPEHNQATLHLVDIHQALQLAYNAGRDSAE